jgi:murein L,D-transpeptidase YafK
MLLAVLALTADLIVVQKADHRMTLYSHGRVIRTYAVHLGPNGGPKRQRGDGRTPEGRYAIDSRNVASRYHRSLRISYPNAADRRNARRRGVDPGGDVMIHGWPNGIKIADALARDWTLGCIAVTDREIEEIWTLVPNGTPIDIRP